MPTVSSLSTVFDQINVLNSSININYNIVEIFILNYYTNEIVDISQKFKSTEPDPTLLYKTPPNITPIPDDINDQKCDLKIVLMLDDIDSYDSNAFYFERNNKTYSLNKGDALVLNSKYTYNDIKLKNGEMCMLLLCVTFVL
jgi:hypothetical protein